MRPLLCILVLLTASAASADERILSYDSLIQVHSDSSLAVTETIRVRAEGDKIKRGIFREFPTTYFRRGGERVTVGFELLSVRRNGRDEPYHTERRSNGVAIYVGHQDRFLSPATYTYEIRYRTDRQLGFFADHDELYWNVTGVDWDFPIDSAAAEVQLPAGVPGDAVWLEGYTGPMGATWRHYRAATEDGRAVFETTRPLGRREGLTIVVGWPKGHVTAPGQLARLGYFLRDNRPLTYGVLGLIALLGYYLFIWNRVGRDPPRGVVIPRYRPPEGESPASMRYLLDMGYDNRCFVSGILSLAVKGYLVIEQQAGRLFKKGGYLLHRKYGSQTPLSPDEHALLRTLFGKGDSLELDDKNHAILQRAKNSHEAELKRKYLNPFFRLNSGWRFLGGVLSLAVIGAAIVWQAVLGGYGLEWFAVTPGGWGTMAVAVTALFVVNTTFARLLRAPTQAGRKLMDEIEGFRLYLSVAEGDELALAGAPRKTPGLYEAYLPFALALGVSQAWSEQFATLFRAQAAAGYSPEWYDGDRFDANNLGRFTSSLSDSFDSAVSSASTPPGESSGSSSGGGGGSSGGGGGGGGGGGW
jgi:uncharacterized membrane protein YgcG